ncbi:hypothetical protein K491DRAFT_721052 [Lophiostoma macrostomum CBS 122681]|uniref:Uncharacterized protein n=1 Tax=Lophiostoma macrostomum CBS 122681 TaxID=1314788 RepID=A0A6A6SR11_9PLEO|nr:hypothetical protein K491DRAFT_721052 [Lophiostoma macrostomum CBS 122681]
MTRSRKTMQMNDKFQQIEKRNIPNWAGPSTSTAPAPTRPSAHQRIPQPVIPRTQPHQTLRDPVGELGWEVLSDASGTEENGDKQARAKRDHLARNERQKAWTGEQKQRAVEQAEINRRITQDEQAHLAKTAERRAWVESGGASTKVPSEKKAGWFGWLPTMPWNAK